MKFTARTEKEVDDRPVFPAGIYPAFVKNATEQTSASGNDMIHVELVVSALDDRKITVHDYLLEAMAKKLRHFAVACELMDEYQAGTMSADSCNGLAMKVQLDIDPPKGQYPAKNIVRDYFVRDDAKAAPKHPRDVKPAKAAPSSAPFSPDGTFDSADIPF